ncbi:MAG: multidrug efflux SMR transporter [Rhizobiaceae bacterium]
MSPTWIVLAVAIAFEVVATSALKETQGFTRLVPSLIAIIGYGLAFYFLSLTLKVLPVGVMYAIWSGAGIVLVAIIGWLLFRQSLDVPALIGIVLILAGVLIINLFSQTVSH